MSGQQTTRSCNMASTFREPATLGPMQKGMGGHAEQSTITTHSLYVLFVRGGSCATACGTSANSSRFTLVARRLPGNGAKGIGKTKSPWISSTIATSDHHEVDTRPPCGLEALKTLESTTDR